MDKDTKIELLKILGMVVILIVLIIGIVWINRDDKGSSENKENSEVVETTENTQAHQENEITENTQTTPENETTENTSDNGVVAKQTYKGYAVAGKIEIPKTKLNMVVLDRSTKESMEVAVGIAYGPGLNKVGNTVILGHNYRNNSFFSHNAKIE